MPEPLAKPLIVTGTPSIVALCVAPLGNVSVVMIAHAASAQFADETAAKAFGSAATILSAGSFSPITPVDETYISRASQWRSCAAPLTVASTAALP
jgi:hypothetical protein